MDFRVVSIGTLASNPFWGEKGPVRAAHATTTLIRSGDRTILVDPSLPGEILDARLKERSGLGLDAVTHVFLTSFRPDLRRGLTALDGATWWVSEREREALGASLVQRFKEAEERDDRDVLDSLRGEIATLRRTEAAPDQLAPAVDLFPLAGRTPGQTGLLLAHPRYTALVCGDAVATSEHLERGQVLPDCFNLEQAQESFREAIEIADLLVLGRDNLVVNPMRPF